MNALAPVDVCFHCGEPLRGSTLLARVEQQERPVCCTGCQAVAELISGTGLGDYYRYRDASAARPRGDDLAADKWRVYADLEFIYPSRKKVDVLEMIFDDVFAEMHEMFLGLPYQADKQVNVQKPISIFN